MTWKILPLTLELAKGYVDALVTIDADTMGERWAPSHFLATLPGKWEISRVVLDGDGTPIGFVIASLKAESVHIHRIVVAKGHRDKGIGKTLMYATARDSVQRGIPKITLKVSRDNIAAIRLYQRLGFSEIARGLENLTLAADADALLKSSP